MRLAILGATGSIGMQTLDVVRTCLPHAKIVALSAFSNVTALAPLVDEFSPEIVWVPDDAAAKELREKISKKKFFEILTGADGLNSCAAESSADVVVNALVGRAGLAPTLAAISAGKNIALANKETLVTAGELVMPLARERGVRITPIDSEHSAIWQCLGEDKFSGALPPNPHELFEKSSTKTLNAETARSAVSNESFEGGLGETFSKVSPKNPVEKIILTASGGPFRGWPREKIAAATAADALRHPNWDMGAKITIDSATLMNKGLELIEAMWLFSQPPEKIEIVIHPQSVIHSMVQFCDGSVLSQMGLPDMRLPILYALTEARVETPFPRVDFLTCGALTFEPPCEENFPCLALAREAARIGGTLPAVMNFLNEHAVGKFLRGEIGFYKISEIIDKAFGIYNVKQVAAAEDIFEAEAWAAEFLKKFF